MKTSNKSIKKNKIKVNQSIDYYDKLYFSRSHSLLSRFHKNRINGILSLVPFNKSVLELGCSSGLISNLICVKKCKVTGVDIRQDCIDYAKLNSNASFINKDILQLNLNKKFDAVICADTLEHFKEKVRKKVVEKIDSHTKKGGLVIITVPSILEILAEPMWKLVRRLKNPNIIFDDEFHAFVKVSEIKRLFKNYRIKEKSFFSAFFTRFVVLLKIEQE